MTSHELANKLLSGDDLPIILYANGHTHNSKFDNMSHGEMVIKPYQETRSNNIHNFIVIGHGSCKIR
jgi:hypothetical protein